MDLVLDLRARRRRRLPHAIGDGVPALRWQGRPVPDGAAAGDHVVFVSASRCPAGDTPTVLLSLANISPSDAVTLNVKVAGHRPTSVTGTMLRMPPRTGPADGPPASAAPASAATSAFTGCKVSGKVVEITVPATSVVVLTLQ